MRILMLTQYYAPEPHDKFTSLALGLTARGHEVQVLTGFPCYPFGKTYPGWRQRLYSEETTGGVRVTRIPQLPDHSNSAARRALYYLSFALSAATLGFWRARRADVVLVYQAALPVGFAGWLLSVFKRSPLVLDVVDLWPESVAASGMMKNGRLLRWIESAAKMLYRHATHICLITKGYRDRLVEMGVDVQKLSVLYMWGHDPGAVATSRTSESLAEGERFVCAYAGAMGPCQGLGTLLEAADRLRGRRDIAFALIGDGIAYQGLVEEAEKRGLDNVRFLGRRPRGELPNLLGQADALVLHLKSDPMSVLSIPSKTIDYLACGKPLLAAIDGETAQLIKDNGCGLATPAEDAAALADAIVALADDPNQAAAMGRAALKTHHTLFNRERQIDRFDEVLREVANQPKEESASLASQAA